MAVYFHVLGIDTMHTSFAEALQSAGCQGAITVCSQSSLGRLGKLLSLPERRGTQQ